jgi:hypothetical protein
MVLKEMEGSDELFIIESVFFIPNKIPHRIIISIFQRSFSINFNSLMASSEEFDPFVFNFKWIKLSVNGVLGNTCNVF